MYLSCINKASSSQISGFGVENPQALTHRKYSGFSTPKAYQAVIPHQQHCAVGKDSGLTAYVERFNNTLRQRLARFVRKTLSFSKSDHMHLIALHAFLVRYNLDIFHGGLV
jgi:IS1 transposase